MPICQTWSMTESLVKPTSSAVRAVRTRSSTKVEEPPLHVKLARCSPRCILRHYVRSLGSAWEQRLDLVREDGRVRRARTRRRTMAVDVRVETVIARPVAEVAAYAGDQSHAPEWYANIDSVDWQTAPPTGVGSRLAFVARFLGRRIEYVYEVVELVPGERLVMQTDGKPF